jgi:hypothetical protein
MRKKKRRIDLQTIALFISIGGNIFLGFYSNYSSIEKSRVEKVLNEKQYFIEECENYLNLYSKWRDIMYLYIYEDEIINDFRSKDTSVSFVIDSIYYQWNNEIEKSYSKLLLISDNDFGLTTMFVSNKLIYTIDQISGDKKMSINEKEILMQEADFFFFEKWLINAKKQIYLYNEGEREGSTFDDFLKKSDMIRKECYKMNKFDY